MSTNEPTPPTGDDQPTVPYTPTDDQPTAAYPPAADQPTAAYPPIAEPVAAPSGYDAPQPGWGAPQPGQEPTYAQPGYGAAAPAAGPDTRPKTLGWIALISGIAGTVLAALGLIPVLWVGLVFAIIATLVLLAAFILGLVALISKKQGGKVLGGVGLGLSVLGGVLATIALGWSLILIGLSAAGSGSGDTTTEPIPIPSTSVDAGETDTDEGDGETTATADETAFVELVRPQVVTLMQEAQPSLTADMITSIYSDEMLVATGKAFLLGGEPVRAAFIEGVSQSGDALTPEQAQRFVDIIVGGAEQYLAG